LPNKPAGSVRFLSLDEALAIHQRLLETFGGPEGIRDMGLLESALYRPQTGYYADLVEMATALFESLLMNHPFVDGNKRAAFFMTDVFLRLNGYRLHLEPKAAHHAIITMIESHDGMFKMARDWIAAHCEQR
jgi:death-on-curing protein